MTVFQRDGHYEFDVPVELKGGFHFRPIMSVIDVANPFGERLTVGKVANGRVDNYVDARSPFELLMLLAVQGDSLRFRLYGVEEEHAKGAYNSIRGILSRE